MGFSVLMAVYKNDSPAYLLKAIASVLEQTLKPNQFVIVGDGPLPDEIIALIEDFSCRCSAIKFIPLAANVGLGAALNEGLKHCEYEFVARMDADDICLPDRFAKQVAFMQAHPDVAVSSGAIEEFDDQSGESIALRKVPQGHEAIAHMARRRNPINHMATFFRKNAVVEAGGYPPLRTSQDYALWSLLLKNGHNMANLPDLLVRVRTGRGFLERRGLSYLKGEVALLRYQKQIGFLNWFDYLINIAIRTAFRLPPAPVKRLLYRLARGEAGKPRTKNPKP